MSDIVTVALIVSGPPTIVGVLNFIASLFSRQQSKTEHKDTKAAVVELEQKVNSRLDKALLAEYARGRADVIAESKVMGPTDITK